MLERPAPVAALPVFCLWPECGAVWAVWLALQTQWRHAGMGGHPTGLDYAGVTAWLHAHGYGFGRARNLRETLGHIGAMECAALSAWAEQAAKKASSEHG